MYSTVLPEPLKLMVLVPVPERFTGVAPANFKVAVCAPDAIEKVNTLDASPVLSVVVRVPPILIVPLSRLNTGLFLLFPLVK